MKEALKELVVELEAAVALVRTSAEDARWTDLEKLARRLLSAGSKLHARARLLGELSVEAGVAAAEVDRALERAELRGQQTIQEEVARLEAERAKKERKARGGGKPSR